MPDISVEVEHYPESNWTETVPSDGLQDWVLSNGAGPSVTLTVPRPDGELLLVAVDGGQAFLGLDRKGELYQFTYDTHRSDEDETEIEISGQATCPSQEADHPNADRRRGDLALVWGENGR